MDTRCVHKHHFIPIIQVIWRFKLISYSRSACLVKSNQQPVPSLGSKVVILRVYIPKPGSNKKRPLGIPTFEDKIVQDVLDEWFEKVVVKETRRYAGMVRHADDM